MVITAGDDRYDWVVAQRAEEEAETEARHGLTLVHFSAQRKHLFRDTLAAFQWS
jgi:hypothetical protein